VVNTNWIKASTKITVTYSRGWDLGIDSITFRDLAILDKTPPTVSITSPTSGSRLSEVVIVSATASDNVGVTGVQFLLDGQPIGSEDAGSPFSVSWDTRQSANGQHTLSALARDAAGNSTLSSSVIVNVSNQSGNTGGARSALRFFGNGSRSPDRDRIKILIDNSSNNLPGSPADIGATDFTIEFWVRGIIDRDNQENSSSLQSCGNNDNWIYGNIIFDRDRYNQGRKFGISAAGGKLIFGVSNDSQSVTACGNTNILDNAWHHIAVQRRINDGYMWIYVDGRLDGQGRGPSGDISYPDDGIPGDFCGGGCVNSDPYLVIGAEKHDAGSSYPSFGGYIDEVRLSSVLRYSGNFSRPTAPFLTDSSTKALYHFDEGSGNTVFDSSNAPGGPSNGEIRYGGNPAGPIWVTSDAPFLR
jgi:hypothetical protein